jgi:hypothetical protein
MYLHHDRLIQKWLKKGGIIFSGEISVTAKRNSRLQISSLSIAILETIPLKIEKAN